MKSFSKAICVASAVLCLNLSALAQDISLKMRDVTIKEAIAQIKKTTGYSFVFSSIDLNTQKRVNLSLKDATIEEAMKQLLQGQEGVGYEIKNKKIVIKRLTVKQAGNTVKVKGHVVDTLGEPVVGATVKEVGTTNGTITNVDGNFSLEATVNNQLEISYMGYQTLAVKAQGGEILAITLKEDTEMLDEVVVIGFGTQKKADLTGAVSTIKVDEVLGDRPVTNLSSALQGTMPGLQISTPNSSPGASPNLNIRGINSINGGSPLVLVDNMPMDINMVNPADIESVNVLKDAAASAIYGAKAAFGVILITTKQGKKGEKIKLNYSGNFAFSKPNNLPKVASPYDLVMGLQNAGQTAEASLGTDVETWLKLLEEYNTNPSLYPGGEYVDRAGSRYYLAGHDRVKDMMDNFGFQQTHNLSISGASDKTSYRISLGILNEDGILYSDKDTYKRYNISSLVSTDVTPWLKVQADFKYADANNQWIDGGVRFGLWGNAMTSPSYFPLEGEVVDGVYYPQETPRTAIEYGEPVVRKNRNLRTMGRAIFSIVEGLTLTAEYAFLYENTLKTDYDKLFKCHTPVGEVRPNMDKSKYQQDKNSAVTHALNVFANYDKTFGKHALNLMAGYNQEDYNEEKSWIKRLDMINGELPSIGQGTGELTAGDGFSEHSTRSLFYRVNYTFGDKYLIGTNGRYDGSSKFPKNSRFGFFPSLSLGWRISSEPFMQWADKYLSNLKFRFTLGEIGNQAIEAYAFIPAMDAYDSKWLVNNGLVTSLKAPALVSPSFTWETVRTYNYGVDLGLFSQKLDLSFDYYVRNTMDMLAPGMELPSALGASAPKENAADLQTKGWELAINWNDRIGDVSYHLGLNLYDSRTHITKFDNEVGLIFDKDKKVINRIGKEMGEIWGYETDRFYTEDDFDTNGKVKPGIPVVEGVIPKPGDVLYVDQDGNGIINNGLNTTGNPGDLKIIGSNTKRFQYGISAGADYKGVSLSVFFQGIGKRDLWRNNELVFPYHSEFSTMFTHQLDYWTPENTDAFYPRLYERAGGNIGANRNIQTRYLLNGAYCRLKNITVSYTLPIQWYKRFNVERVNVFFSGEDLWTHYNTPKGIEPDMDPLGGGWGYPTMQKMSFGINVTL